MTSDHSTVFQFRGPLGVPVEISGSVGFLCLLFVGLTIGAGGHVLWGLGVFAVLIGSIFAHELGHAWGARVQGVRVDRIVLHGGGGFCQHAAAETRKTEFIVLMGPLTNLALWAVCSLAGTWLWAASSPSAFAPMPQTPPMGQQIAFWFWLAADLNFMLFLLNLLPVQPLDGGKLLHAWLLRLLPDAQALQVTGAIGLVVTAFWLPAMLVFFALFGFVLLFFPSWRLHMEMFRAGRRLRRLHERG